MAMLRDAREEMLAGGLKQTADALTHMRAQMRSILNRKATCYIFVGGLVEAENNKQRERRKKDYCI
jgi:hypothetical protein